MKGSVYAAISMLFFLAAAIQYFVEDKSVAETPRCAPEFEHPIPAPQLLSAAPRTLEFENAAPSSMIDFRFEIENVSREPLFLDHASGSCGCTSIQVERGELAPSQRREVSVRVKTGATAGTFLKRVEVHYHSLSSPAGTGRLIVPVKGTIDESALSQPPGDARNAESG